MMNQDTFLKVPVEVDVNCKGKGDMYLFVSMHLN